MMFPEELFLSGRSRWRSYRNKREERLKRLILAAGSIDHKWEFRYGFFGELGYGLIGFLPYLKFLSEQVGPIRTAGLEGSTPFWDFSSDHIEIPIAQADMWGDRSSALMASEFLGKDEYLVAPLTDSGYKARDLTVSGHVWRSLELHKTIEAENYRTLNLSSGKFNSDILACGKFVVINVKNYFNWGNTHIANLYSSEEVLRIALACRENNLTVVLNRFPAIKETTNIYLEDDFLGDALEQENVLDMADLYLGVSSAADRNRLQTAILRDAEHVFASQGGNAVLALLCNRSVTVLMRGGYDYPDYKSLAKIYGGDLDLIYEISQSQYLAGASQMK